MKSPFIKDKMYFVGLIFIAVSFTVFLFRLGFANQSGLELGALFMVNYLMAILYLVLLCMNGRFKKGRNGLPVIMLLLIISLISAYSLNLDMNVFDDSVPWFCVVLIVVCVNYLAFNRLDLFPLWAKYLICIVAGIGMIVFCYLSIYLVPLYILSIPGILLLGLSLHSFVPFLFCVYTVILISRTKNRSYLISFIGGICFAVFFIIIYTANWYINLKPINRHYQYTSISENNGLPGWVDVAQKVHKNATTERILKTGITYAETELGGDMFWRIPQKNFGKRMHDPLVMISQGVCGRVNLPVEDRIKVLESLYDSRHEAQERLWSGEDIKTEQVSSNIQIWPQYRMAYTEMNVILTHVPKDQFWADRQEGIYTFHLPEGGVVTSLSLWINGKEEKGVLTSKSKADSAYKTIVGQEYRDPCVVHWQEGNTVSIRVFPILNGQSRKFKIGITTPLKRVNQQLVYDNIYFDGPVFSGAEENVSVTMKQSVKNLIVPDNFKAGATNNFQKSGSYEADWSLSFDEPPISQEKFQFGNYTYQMTPLIPQIENIQVSNIYLDINKSWTLDETKKIYEKLKGKKIFVSQGGEDLTEVTAANSVSVFEELCRKQFSLFPFYKIDKPADALVITHSGSVSPVIKDLRTSEFLTKLTEYFKHSQPVRVFDFGTERSPYIKSLKEFRVLAYERGTMTDLFTLLQNGKFQRFEESNDSVALSDAGILLSRTQNCQPGTAPDHLMRLFSYNHIMSEAGRGLLAGDEEPDNVVGEAQEAYVVSPVSSLIVLETQQDYERFKIRKGLNSLENASLHSKGSVPEPGEWALIFAVFLVCGIVYYRPDIFFKIRLK